ncbi:MAG: sugar phosphate isomerase/epimerase [Lachnospiraceae bacterium]|nr:sugar phosphate isomerase/epimerase [Lachnospiraceae bacterium]
MLRYATSCYTWKDLLIPRYITIDESIRWTAALGFDGYEITNLTDSWMDVPFDLNSMRRTANECGIVIPSWAMAADWSLGIRCQADKAKNEMDMAQVLGVRVFRTDTYVAETAAPYADEVIDAVRELADYAAARGMQLVTENHGTFLCTPERLLPLFEKVNHPNFGLLYDGANFAASDSDPLEAAKLLAPLVRHVHMKDAHLKPGTRLFPGKGWQKTLKGNYWRCAITGQGTVPYEEILPVLLKAGFDGWLVQEFDGIEDPVEAMCEGFDYSKRLAASLKAE